MDKIATKQLRKDFTEKCTNRIIINNKIYSFSTHDKNNFTKDFNALINSAKAEERERCAKSVRNSTLITDSLLLRHKSVKLLLKEIAKEIIENQNG